MALMAHRWRVSSLVILVLATLTGLVAPAPLPAVTRPTIAALTAPVTSHPRLWITAADLPRLRTWATASNPLYTRGLQVALAQAISTYTTKFYPGGQPNPSWPDSGGTTWEPYVTESYAEFFAFMSLIDPDPSARTLHAQRARNLLMYVMNEAVKGPANAPFRWPQFTLQIRSTGYGEAFPLTVDWLQASNTLTPQDTATIRTVFLRWAHENLTIGIAGGEHPQPVGVMNSSQLLTNRTQLRWAANNFYSGHMRQITMMALSLDAPDDPPLDPTQPEASLGNTLRSYITDATGAWLYQQYAIYEDPSTVSAALNVSANGLGIARGGASPEGSLYGLSLGTVFGALLALHTAGYADVARSGPQIHLITSAYWDQLIDGYLHATAPVPEPAGWMGTVYPMANYGDVVRTWFLPEYIMILGTLGRYDEATGNVTRLQKLRWMAANLLEGGAAKLYQRAGSVWSNSYATHAILYFLLFDPTAPTAPDPRPNLPTTFYAPGVGRLLARSDWTPNASWFSYLCSWNSINHQHGNCNQFEFYRKGEWLTKERSGYADDFIGGTPDYHNTVALQNDTPATLAWFEGPIAQRGGQWREGLAAGDPTVITSASAAYVYAQGDATNLYNRTSGAQDILHASRSLVWLKPDHLVIYDRATSKTANRFKRFNLTLLSNPTITGKRAQVTTARGQQFSIDTLIPSTATLTSMPAEHFQHVAELEPTQYRLVVEDPSNPSDVRFLHVLQGADAGVVPAALQVVQSSAGTPFSGVVVGTSVVLFPVNLRPALTSLTYTVPATTTGQVVTGLLPHGGYDVTMQHLGSSLQMTISPGTAYVADSGGVLALGALEDMSIRTYVPLLPRS